jgi:uncharacterized phage protein gp47/JayE
MALNLPSNRKEVYNRITSDFTAQIPDSGASLPTSYLSSLIKSLAYRIYDNYQKITLMINEFFIQTASEAYIAKWGDVYGVTRNPAVGSTGNIVLTGTDSTLIPSGTTFQSSSGISYSTSANTTITESTVNIASMSRTGTTVTVNFTAEHNLASGIIIDSITGATPTDFNATSVKITVTSANQFQFTQAGTAGSASGTLVAQWTTTNVELTSTTQGADTNITAGGLLTLSSPISGADNSVYVDFNEISGGSDQESAASYRARVLFRIQFPFSFFNKNFLISQAKEVSGVTRVWIFSPSTTSAAISISAITRDGQIATATSTAHGLVDGSYVSVVGAVGSEYNIVEKRVIVIDADNFAYVVSGSPSTPATGTISASYSYVEEGQVRIGFTRDNDDSIIPSSTEVDTVKDKILEAKPAHMSEDDIIVFSPTAVPVTVTFSSLSPNTTAMQTALNSSLTDFFKISNNIGDNITLASLNGLISRTIDSAGNVPIYTLSAPSGDTTIGLNELATFETPTYP